jgi:homoserine O-acetyltransferase
VDVFLASAAPPARDSGCPGVHQPVQSQLLIKDAEDHANPPELGTVERAMTRVKHGRYVLIPAGPHTHGHFSLFYAELWKPYLIEFMKTQDPPLAAAAD